MVPLKNIDTDLVNAFREGSVVAFREIYESLEPKVYRFAYSFVKDSVQSEEIVQETFISLWENKHKFEEGRALEPYVFTISKRLILDSFKKATSTNSLREKLFSKIKHIHNDTEEKIIHTDLLRFAEGAIGKLPKQQQIVFRLSRFEGLSYDEIAERLDLSRNTVKNHLVTALKTLKSHFGVQEMIYIFIITLFS